VLDFFNPDMKVVWRFLLLLVVVSAGRAARPENAGPPAQANSPHPNIILITLDTTRADRMGFLGSGRGLTPNLDALAKQSVVFTRAYAQVPLTTPSHAALLTGTYPQFSHIEDLGETLAGDIPYLPDLLHSQGYHTAAFVGAQILDPASTAPGFERGFDVYDADFHSRKPGEDRYHSIERRAEDVANRAMGWLSHNSQGHFFIWLHFYDPHDPYDPPEPFKSNFASALYDGEIAYTDSVVGSVLEVLARHGLYQDSVIAIAADHGEAFGEHGEERHGMFLYDETIHVPLLLKLPGERLAGRRVEQRVALAALAPSLLQAAGIAAPPAMQAHSLFPYIEAAKTDAAAARGTKASVAKSSAPRKAELPSQPVYSMTDYGHRTFGWATLRSWRAGKYLYVQAPKRELYDQSSDPGARKNLAAASTAIANTLNSQLDEFQRKTSGALTAPAKLSPEQAEKLRALGYLAADSAAISNGSHATVDPKDKIDVANKFHRALINLEDDHYDEAIVDLREVVCLEPNVSVGYLVLGRALVHQKQYQEAVPFLRTAAEKAPDSPVSHFELGKVLVYTGQWDAALVEMQAAAALKENSPQLHYFLAGIYTKLKRAPEATAEYEQALKLEPDYYDANLAYGRLLLMEGLADQAVARLSQAIKVNPDSAEAHGFLADGYQQLGQTESAASERAKAAELKSRPPQ
jgi:arylsulfatase A-like enzyme/Flp pilus assembly protein TadD